MSKFRNIVENIVKEYRQKNSFTNKHKKLLTEKFNINLNNIIYNKTINELLIETNIDTINEIFKKAEQVYDRIKMIISSLLGDQNIAKILLKTKNNILFIQEATIDTPAIALISVSHPFSGLYNKKTNTIYIPLLNDDNSLNVEKTNQFLLGQYKTAIIHELTHYYDSKCYKASSIKDTKYKDYNNDKFEIKAYTNELINAIKPTFFGNVYLEMKINALSGIKAVEKTLNSALYYLISNKESIFNKMSEQNKKRVYKDIYNYFSKYFIDNFGYDSYYPIISPLNKYSNDLYNQWQSTHNKK